MTTYIGQNGLRNLVKVIRLERRAFAAKIRMARAVLGWNQSELAFRIGLTQRAVHKLEQGETEPRRTTVLAIEEVWHEEGIEFENMADGGFRGSVRSSLLDRPVTAPSRRHRAARPHLGVSALARQ